MKRIFLFLILFAIPCVAQTPATSTGKAETKGACSPAVTGSKNTFTIACGIGQQQGKQMIDILNKVLANQLDPTVVMAKLDEILKGINPNLHVTTYNCVGQWKSIGPSSSALYDAATGGDVVEYDQ